MIKVEICIAADELSRLSQSVAAAKRGGASTIELCSAMELEGLSPDTTQITCARAALGPGTGLMVMARPRAGDFCYQAREVQALYQQIDIAADAGADGVVLGVLDKRDLVDAKLLNALVSAASAANLQVTFHRAIDATPNPTEALETLIDCGVNRVLSSGVPWGQAGGAEQGIAQLNDMFQLADRRIELVIGGGINSDNIVPILNALPQPLTALSVHAYSSVLSGGIVNEGKVAALYHAANG